MDRQHGDEHDLHTLFDNARTTDSTSTPSFQSMWFRPVLPARQHRIALPVAMGVALGCTVVLAVWLAAAPGDVDARRPVPHVLIAKNDPPVSVGTDAPRDITPRDITSPDVEPPNAKPAAPTQQQPASIVTKVPSEDLLAKLKSLGYVGPMPSNVRSESVEVVAKKGAVELDAGTQSAPKFADAFVQNLPVQGRYYQNALTLATGSTDGDGNPNGSGARQGDFKVVAGGVANTDPLTGDFLNFVNADSIEEIETVTAGAGVDVGRAQGGYARIIQRQGASEPEGSVRLNTESYTRITPNELLTVREHPLSTFSIDVDTASYSNVRRFLNAGQLPPVDAVRAEELINYFRYDYPAPTDRAPFAASVEVAGCPWNESHRLARIGLAARAVTRAESGGSNLVFLIDVSGSMDSPQKLPLLKSALKLMVNELDGGDRVAIVVYAGAAGVVLPSTSGGSQAAIHEALERLGAGGSTNGGEGLKRAYELARQNFVEGGINRVVLATDGDFNVGVTGPSELVSIVQDGAAHGVFLTALGFGMGNYKDSTLEMLADKGNGNYAYIDDLREARKVLVEQIGGTLVTVAKDVKIQVEFNPAEVAAYKLIGYENRLLRSEEFNDDRKDAGEIGSGHTVTALYEIVPVGAESPAAPGTDPLKYQSATAPSEASGSGELLTVKLRYKDPAADSSKLQTFAVKDSGLDASAASPDFKFAAAVAEFALLLRQGSKGPEDGFARVRTLAREGTGRDEGGYRAEFLGLVDRALELRKHAIAAGN